MGNNKRLYLCYHGDLKLIDNCILIESENDIKKYSVDGINEILILGEVRIDRKFLEIISELGIIIHFFNYYGYYSGSFYPNKHNNVSDLVLKQVQCYLDNNKRLEIAKLIVGGAVHNILQVIKYYKYRGKDLSKIESNIEILQQQINNCTSINELMAIEGNVRNYYYKAFDTIIENQDFVFEERSKRPPKNYINTLISFGNSMLYTTILSQIYYTNLDPRIGYLHTSNYRRYTLNLDIAEIFKPIIVDRTIFNVVNKAIITADDFEFFSEGIILKDKGRKDFVYHFENKLDSYIAIGETGEIVSYRELIRKELHNLENYIFYGKSYKPFAARW